MIPPAFDHVVAESVDEAVAALSAHGEDAKLLAGGQSLIPLLRLRLAEPAVLVDLGRVGDLSDVRDEGDHLRIGALVCHHELASSPLVRAEVPVLATAASSVGDPQVRNRGTLGGSLAHGDGASDLPAVALALGATLVSRSPRGQREIPIDDFFHGFLETALEPDEMLVEVRVPKPDGPGSFVKFRRRAQDWAMVGVTTAVLDGRTRIALINMGSVPVRASASEEALAAGSSVAEASRLAAVGTEPPSDIHGSAEYRRHLAGVLVRRALEQTAAS